MFPPEAALLHYPDFFRRAEVVALGNNGGFSGSSLWKVKAHGVDFALKALPAEAMSFERMVWIHGLMERARSRGLTYVPTVVPLTNGGTICTLGNALWELASWMPGMPDVARPEQACIALAKLHLAWAESAEPQSVCPGVVRRIKVLSAWQARLKAGWMPTVRSEEPFGFFLSIMPGLTERIRKELEILLPWTAKVYSLQPCVCDPWSDHFLFQNGVLHGLIDFASVKRDHIAVDLARLLGSFLPASPREWEPCLKAYQTVRPLTEAEILLISVLEPSGALVSILNWMDWVFCQGRRLSVGEVEERVKPLLSRVIL